MFYLSIYIKHVFKVKKPSTLSSIIQNIVVVRDAINAELLQIPTAWDNSHLKCFAPSENI